MKYPEDPKLASWLFRTHSFAELHEWTARMRFFRFCRAFGGHANDGDQLLAALRVETEADLLAVSTQLGVVLRTVPIPTPAPIAGARYTIAEFSEFPTPIVPFPRFEQPGWVRIAEVACSVWVSPGRLELTLQGAAGDPYEVTDQDVENAVKIETLMAPLAERVIDPPRESERCFTKDA
jgi:hypothetical protein